MRDICTPQKYTTKQGEEKTYWYKIGTAFIDGDKIGLKFAALPVTGDCQVFKKQERTAPATNNSFNAPPQDDGELPF